MSKLGPADIYPEFIKREPRTPASQELLAMLNHLGSPFTTPQGSLFLSYRWGDGCSQTTYFRNPAIRSNAIREYLDKHARPPRENDLRSACRAFQAQATRLRYDVHLRIGDIAGNIHFDPAWHSGPLAGKHIQITPDGWKTATNRVNTVLPATVAAQPQVDPHRDTPPDPVASLDPFRRLLRLENDHSAWLRVLVWLFAAFRPPVAPDTPRDHPILQISGPAGSGKTTAARLLRALVDPNDAPINFTPSSELAAGRLARDNHVVFIDGVTRLARRGAEVLARLSTGLPAKFHGDLQNLSRPIVITTNEPDAASRLASRVLPVHLPALEAPLPQDEVRKQFETLRPSLVAAILTLLSTALRRLPDTPSPDAARFPEAVQWAQAALEPEDPNELVCVTRPHDKLEADLTDLVINQPWKGTATELKEALSSPLSTKALSQALNKISAVSVTKTRTCQTRTIHVHSPPSTTDFSLSHHTVGQAIVLGGLSSRRSRPRLQTHQPAHARLTKTRSARCILRAASDASTGVPVINSP